jgi:two-component system sensor histidine kinase PilS (NtrC family)
VLIVDIAGRVRTANPAAEMLLRPRPGHAIAMHDLTLQTAWAPLLQLTRSSLRSGQDQEQDVTIKFEGQGPRPVRVRTRLTAPEDIGGEVLCVLFLQDQRELEARMRTDKLASMGRMSTAVAHEIRNPLAAIAQANSLLEEELDDPRQLSLTRMVSQNAQRLAKIVDDILNASHIQPHDGKLTPLTLTLNDSVSRVCKDWAEQTGNQHRLHTDLCDDNVHIYFDGDHLRRVLVNLLDNARRYASEQPHGIQVQTLLLENHQARLCVWSDGLPIDHGVELHLFEPFFSSESRSSGLGLYICRELCESHGAHIDYQRTSRFKGEQQVDGNEFFITLERPGVDLEPAPN